MREVARGIVVLSFVGALLGCAERGKGGVETESRRAPLTAHACASGYKSVFVGPYRSCAVRTDGLAECWGAGPLGDRTTPGSSLPAIVSNLTNVKLMSVGGAGHVCAFTQSGPSPQFGSVWCWGHNIDGELGIGGPAPPNFDPLAASMVPVAVTAPAPVSLASSTYDTCDVDFNGSVWCWGWDRTGLLPGIVSNTPYFISSVSDATALAFGDAHGCALRRDETLLCWGLNSAGQVGIGDPSMPVPIPTVVAGIGPVAAIAAGRTHTCALLSNGTVDCWGQMGSVDFGAVPTPVAGLAGVTALACGATSVCVLTGSGQVSCMGDVLGDGSVGGFSTTLVTVGLSHPAVSLSAGGSSACAVLDTGGIECWGSNASGQLGDGTYADAPVPVAVKCPDYPPPTPAGLINLALNPSGSGFPTPLQSDQGWGGGAQPWQIVDGLHHYDTWASGLAFTGGHTDANGGGPYLEPAGVRHAVIDLGTPRTFQQVTMWWHGDAHTPDRGTLEYWDGSTWKGMASVQRFYGVVTEDGTNSGMSTSDVYTFPPVTASKVRYTFDNSQLNVFGSYNIHGWLYEMEVWGPQPPPPGGADGGADVGAPGADGGGLPPPPDPDGTPCVTGTPCGSGLCVDGVCCASACGGGAPDDCQACSIAAGGTADGVCSALAPTTVCRASTGACDAAETCDGVTGSCPANGFLPAGTICQSATHACELDARCSGTGGVCPPVVVSPSCGVIPPAGPKKVSLEGGLAAEGGVEVTLPSATGAGTVTYTPGLVGAVTGQYQIIPTFAGSDPLAFVLTTTATTSGKIRVCVNYGASPIVGGPMELFVQIQHDYNDGNGFVPVNAPTPPANPDLTTHVICGQVNSLSPFVVVIPKSLPPVIAVPAGITAEATRAAGATVTYVATATDPDQGPLEPRCTPASGSTFPIGTTQVTCTVTDGSGVPAAASFNVTVADTQGPAWTNVPGVVSAFATSTAGAKVSYTPPKATDAVDGDRPVTCALPPDSQFPVKTTTVTCKASDLHQHETSRTFPVSVTYQAPTDGTFFLFPVRPDGKSVFRTGLPLPVRFKLQGASANITNLQAKLVVTKLSNAVQGTAEGTSDESVDDTDFLFKYRPLLKIYAYRWRTRDQTQGTYQLRVDLGDGVTHQINVSLKTK